MESNIVHLNALSSGSAPVLHENFIVQTQFQLWHSAEIGLHFDRSHNFRVQYGPVGSNQKIQFLYNVEEDFILLVFDAFSSPGCGSRQHASDVLGQLFFLDLMCLSSLDESLQSFRVGSLGIPEIHHLVQKLVDYHKIIFNAFLFELIEVVFHHRYHQVEEVQYNHNVCILICNCHNVERVVLDIHVSVWTLLKYWLHIVLIISKNSPGEVLSNRHGNICTIVSR
mmetsp:Transcript_29191/g.40685  ORF Transcript_29191/g.40685 Transcript_29191/m.40685 type:complete len:225 (+) Transcript_29191:919-1593(+)